MKKLLSVVLLVCIIASFCTVSAYADDVPPLPNAIVYPTSSESYAPLSYALYFAVDFENLTDAQRNYYSNWPADFVLTCNKDVQLCAGNIQDIFSKEFVYTAEGCDGYIAGSYPSFAGGLWVPIPFLGTSEKLDGVPPISFNDNPLKLKANNGVAVMDYLLDAVGFSFDVDFGFIMNPVKEFSCGIYLTDEFLLNNPNTNVTVQLILTNPDTGERHVIGDTHYYNSPGSTEDIPITLPEVVEIDKPIELSGEQKLYIELQDKTFNGDEFKLAPGVELFKLSEQATVTITNVDGNDEELKKMRDMLPDEYCVSKGSIIVRASHDIQTDGSCKYCKVKLAAPNPYAVPSTADNSNMPLWTVLFIGFAAVVLLTGKKKKA